MIPTTIFEVIDNSKSVEVKAQTTPKPLFLTVISSDKGPEDLRIVDSADMFYKLYGKDISFARHGQPLLQAANIVDNGGSLLVKRVVADDSALANIAVVAKLSKTQVQKTDAKGRPIYQTPSGDETTVADGNTPVMIDCCKIKYECKSVSGVKTIQAAAATINSMLNDADDNGGTYPLFVIADNGRGSSHKKFRISPLYDDSKYLNYIRYSLEIIENDEIIETLTFSLNPIIVENGTNKSLQNVVSLSSNQVTAISFDDNYELFVNQIASIAGTTAEYCKASDLLFGKEVNLIDLNNIQVDPTGFNLSYIYGISLDNGSDGSFGIAPFGTLEWEKRVVEVFDGSFSDDIYDVDKYKIDAIVDANYPSPVKRAIENLVAFREDLSYFRDLGLGLSTLDEILAANEEVFKNKYCFTYGVSYDIIDPYTKKQIPVTIGYSIARLLINHFNSGRVRPFAGQLYGVTIPEAIPGTVNYIPKVTPSENQKQILSDNRINYVSYYDNVLTIETLYTSQNEFTQLSFINNILAIQEVVKAVRTRCPKIRYSFIDGDDLETYRRDVQNILDNYISNFKSLKMVYTADDAMLSNKVYYASIEVAFKDFVQTEYFKLFAI